MPYVVIVADNFHVQEDDSYECGAFDDAATAIHRCRRIVDRCLADLYRPGMTGAALWEAYAAFGDSAFLSSRGVPVVEFSGWEYARERCAELTAHPATARWLAAP
jgi:hypothetical protein